MNAGKKEIILLTGSEGRRGIVRRAGLPWRFMAGGFDEEGAAESMDRRAVNSVAAAADYCAFLSGAKNKSAAARFKGAVVITADTVVFNEKLLEKPGGEAGVYEMIEGLNGKPHHVITAVTISGVKIEPKVLGANSKYGNGILLYGKQTFAAVSRVLLSGVSRTLIKEMIERENPYACSGGYTIDGMLKPYFTILSGTEENIIGLPLSEILEILNL